MCWLAHSASVLLLSTWPCILLGWFASVTMVDLVMLTGEVLADYTALLSQLHCSHLTLQSFGVLVFSVRSYGSRWGVLPTCRCSGIHPAGLPVAWWLWQCLLPVSWGWQVRYCLPWGIGGNLQWFPPGLSLVSVCLNSVLSCDGGYGESMFPWGGVLFAILSPSRPW